MHDSVAASVGREGDRVRLNAPEALNGGSA
jgi:hypothetical protein